MFTSNVGGREFPLGNLQRDLSTDISLPISFPREDVRGLGKPLEIFAHWKASGREESLVYMYKSRSLWCPGKKGRRTVSPDGKAVVNHSVESVGASVPLNGAGWENSSGRSLSLPDRSNGATVSSGRASPNLNLLKY